ncbi:PorT family protein [Paludibacter sp. 221]|uniref:porin family protein n=1 Tax=Paludibacter sp. 221 TaxID=2302939 RepID=UPI0013D1B5E8|nr:porin family protein [Paludibacter sp. 221]NDV46687.1 PorT family protein [Paludibacter sp. 221]
MKKLILSLVLFFSVATLAHSQLFNIGIKTGYNSSLTLSSISSTVNYDFSNEFFNNMHFGVFGRLYFGKLYVQPELLYSMEKRNYQVTINDVVNQGENLTFDNLLKMKTIDVPVLVGYKLLDLKLVSLRGYAGPKFRFDVGSTLALDPKNIAQTDMDKLSTDFKNAAVGLELGLGVDVLMLTFDVRYNFINNLYETTWDSVGDAVKGIPASTFIFSLGWKIF